MCRHTPGVAEQGLADRIPVVQRASFSPPAPNALFASVSPSCCGLAIARVREDLRVAGVVGAAGDSLSQSAAVAQDKFAAVEGDVEARIKKNPWGAVAVAGLIGLLIGKMS
jgi:hypothetical protein